MGVKVLSYDEVGAALDEYRQTGMLTLDDELRAEQRQYLTTITKIVPHAVFNQLGTQIDEYMDTVHNYYFDKNSYKRLTPEIVSERGQILRSILGDGYRGLKSIEILTQGELAFLVVNAMFQLASKYK